MAQRNERKGISSLIKEIIEEKIYSVHNMYI